MNTTRFTFLTSSSKFIEEIKKRKVPVIQNSDSVYMSVIPVTYETRLYDVVHEIATRTKASISVHIFYQDPGSGESSQGWMEYYEGKELK